MTKFMKNGLLILICAFVFTFGFTAVWSDDTVFAAVGPAVVFESGEGPAENTITGMPDEDEIAKWTIGSEQVLPDAPKTSAPGFEFLYWKTTEIVNGEEKEVNYNAGDKYRVPFQIQDSITFTAVWGVKVTYESNLNDPSETITVPEEEVIPYGSDLSLDEEMTSANHSFLGWATAAKKDDVTAEYKKGDVIKDVKAPLTLYGVWKANYFSVIYHANTGSDEGDSAVLVPVDSTKYMDENLTATIMGNGKLASTNKNYTTMKDATPTRTGYTFVGWATSATATTAEYQPGATIEKMDKDVDLYAVWKEGAAATESSTKTTSTTPQTGDDDQFSLYVIMAVLSLLGIVYLCYDQKKVKGTK